MIKKMDDGHFAQLVWVIYPNEYINSDLYADLIHQRVATMIHRDGYIKPHPTIANAWLVFAGISELNGYPRPFVLEDDLKKHGVTWDKFWSKEPQDISEVNLVETFYRRKYERMP